MFEKSQLPPERFLLDNKTLDLIYYVSFIVLVVNALIISYVLLKKLSDKFQRIRRDEVKENVQEFLSDWIIRFEGSKEPKTLNALQEFPICNSLKKKIYQEVLYEEIFQFNQVLLGFEKQTLKDLYLLLSFDRLLTKKLKSRKWYVLVSSVNQLISIEDHNTSDISGLINHPNQQVRLSALKAKIAFSENPFPFLARLKYPLSEWEIFEVIKTIKLKDLKNFDDIHLLINHDEPSLQVLGINLARIFQLLYLKIDVKKLLDHADLKVRRSMIEFITECGNGDHVVYLKKIFEEQLEPQQKVILNYIQEYGCDEDIPFLEYVIKNYNPALKIWAIKVLYHMNQNSKIHFNYLLSSDSKDRRKITQHLIDNQW
ncbi:hypothetical protein SAMN04515674_113132 [Pseudarcicella hirudinis]|uniref:HEAT repeat-containing protein n=1 Tax=Pseudarcicella hirudinis TaxID=1079859 RepID=A0A1I5X4Y7_9BACT|nr:hypothetical protein [Pseudarcicella hirudinis]SFQ26886.1 hypothetical protein SAMN04515674_113132 [Pseudarcicella hirudinis]